MSIQGNVEMIDDMVRCMVCGVLRRELNGHIRIHNLTAAKYKILYPGSKMSSANASKLKSNSLKGKKRKKPNLSQEQRNYKAQMMRDRWKKLKETLGDEKYKKLKIESAEKMRASKGENFRHSDETIARMRGPRPASRGRKFSDEHKANISKAASLRQNRGSHSEETKNKMKAAWIKRKSHPNYNAYVENMRKNMTTPEAIERIRSNVAKRLANPMLQQKQSNTNIEIKMASWLAKNDLKYIQQHSLLTNIGIFVYDFFIPSMNMLVEVDGEYWHSKSLEQINRDKLKIRKANEANLICVRISDQNWCPEIIFASSTDIDNHNQNLIKKRLDQNRLGPV